MDKYYDVLAEIPRVRKDFGYPPLVTPTEPDRRHAGRDERYLRRALQDLPEGIHGPCCAASTASCPAPVNEEVRAKAGIGDDRGHHLPPRRPHRAGAAEVPRASIQAPQPAARRTCSPYALFPRVAEKFIKLRNTRHPLGQRFIKPLEHAEKVERPRRAALRPKSNERPK